MHSSGTHLSASRALDIAVVVIHGMTNFWAKLRVGAKMPRVADAPMSQLGCNYWIT
jgi:hypothetical protein